MSSRFMTSSRLAWAAVLILILLALLSLPGIRSRVFHRTPVNTNVVGESNLPAQKPNARMPTEARETAPGFQQTPGAATMEREIVFHVIDAVTKRDIEGASLHTKLIGMPQETPVGGELITDKNGRCAVPITPPIAVSVRADGYVSRRANFRSGDDVPDEYTFKLEKGSAIGGYVHNQAGKPVGDVQLTITVTPAVEPRLTDRDMLNTSIIAQTDASGYWACNEVPADLSIISLRLVHPEYIACEYWTQPYPAERPFGQKIQPTAMVELRALKAVMVMQYGFLVTGIVDDENGKALAGATVSEIERGQAVSTISTGLDGRFALTDSKLGEMVL